jgi:diamine N-acetyltransferase
MQLENFLNKQGLIKAWPSKQEAKHMVLRFIGYKFETGRFYTEKEVNQLIDENHAFGDYFLLRRGIVDLGIMKRTANGARYWRGGLWPDYRGFETQRMHITAATEEDADDIGRVYQACSYMSQWTGQAHDNEGLALLLAGTDLPPDGCSEFNHLVVLRAKDSGVIGIAQYYTAYPDANCMWLGFFLVHPDYQNSGYGSEFMESFIHACKQQGYRQIGLGVALRNQPALKFWVKSGFTNIFKVKMDGESGEGSLGLLGLTMTL